MKNIFTFCLVIVCLIGYNKASAQTELTFYTTKGVIKVQLTDLLTPRTVDSFRARVAKKFYDGLTFHRVVHGFVIQGGDPLGDGTGTPGYHTPEEIDTPTLKNNQGTIAMANNGPGTNTDGCQFYFNLVNNNFLDGGYTVFGNVTTGLTVVQTIGAVATNSSDKPLTNVYMDSVRITKFAASVSTVSNGIVAAVYPNPCRRSFSIDLPTITTKVQITDMEGQVVYSTEAKGKLNIDFSKQPTGMYLITSTNAEGSSQTKLIVQ